MLTGKKVIVGITGGIAAYKTPLLIRLLIKNGAEVKVAATKSALQFVTPTTLETLSKNKIYTDLFAEANEYNTEHVALKDWADFMIVAPATANCIGKLASAIADDALSTLLLAFNKPLFICPAMNTNMLEHFSVERNIQWLKDNGVRFIEPSVGELACGVEGRGRMEEPENILDKVLSSLSQSATFVGKKVLITAGPTYEAIDPVRFIGNHSSGLMGIEIARAFADQGAEVTLVLGPSNISPNRNNINLLPVTSAKEMYDAVMTFFPKTDIAVLSAAVADFRPEIVADQKIKKNPDTDSITLKLVKTDDILKTVGSQKKENQVVVGFALETENGIANAKKKLHTKNIDLIVLNEMSEQGVGFKTKTNKISIINKNDEMTEFDLKPKSEVALDVLNAIYQYIN